MSDCPLVPSETIRPAYEEAYFADTQLMRRLGFDDVEQVALRAFTHERGFDSIRAMVKYAVLVYQDRPTQCTPFDCGHRGFISVYPRKDGGTQCTACANEARRLT